MLKSCPVLFILSTISLTISLLFLFRKFHFKNLFKLLKPITKLSLVAYYLFPLFTNDSSFFFSISKSHKIRHHRAKFLWDPPAAFPGSLQQGPPIQLAQFTPDPWWAHRRLTQKSSVASLEWPWCRLSAWKPPVPLVPPSRWGNICCVIEKFSFFLFYFILFYFLYLVLRLQEHFADWGGDCYQSSSKINLPTGAHGLMDSQ